MLVGIVQPAKHPAESFPCGIEFVEVQDGEGIVSVTATAIRLSDGLDVSADVLDGMPVISGTTVLHRIHAGMVGERYRVHIQIATDGVNIYRHWFELPMIPTAV